MLTKINRGEFYGSRKFTEKSLLAFEASNEGLGGNAPDYQYSSIASTCGARKWSDSALVEGMEIVLPLFMQLAQRLDGYLPSVDPLQRK